jgi:hypothetical protein
LTEVPWQFASRDAREVAELLLEAPIPAAQRVRHPCGWFGT